MDEMTEREKMLKGMCYEAADPELVAMRIKARKLVRAYNELDADQEEQQRAILAELLPESVEPPMMEAPIRFDYGCNTRFGRRVFTNFNFCCLDVCPVEIGDDVLFGPNCTVATPMHPLLPEERCAHLGEDGQWHALEYGSPITIGAGTWVAANVVICGGVTIGEGCVIGAGSVVTRDIPARSLAAGNPCRVIRALTDEDRLFRQ